VTKARANVEYQVMMENFPYLQPFESGGKVGFQGYLRVKGRTYAIVVEAFASKYPFEEPRVFLDPHPENHHWIRHFGEQSYLCYQRDNAWSPARSTFASCVAVAIRYVEAFS